MSREDRGILPSRQWKLEHQREIWYPGDTISVAIGQGSTVKVGADLTHCAIGPVCKIGGEVLCYVW